MAPPLAMPGPPCLHPRCLCASLPAGHERPAPPSTFQSRGSGCRAMPLQTRLAPAGVCQACRSSLQRASAGQAAGAACPWPCPAAQAHRLPAGGLCSCARTDSPEGQSNMSVSSFNWGGGSRSCSCLAAASASLVTSACSGSGSGSGLCSGCVSGSALTPSACAARLASAPSPPAARSACPLAACAWADPQL